MLLNLYLMLVLVRITFLGLDGILLLAFFPLRKSRELLVKILAVAAPRAFLLIISVFCI